MENEALLRQREILKRLSASFQRTTHSEVRDDRGSHCTGTGTARVHHSDWGSQYASEGFRTLLKNEEIVQSMSRRGNCYDNALGESFWATVKTECFDNFRQGIPETKAQAIQMLFGTIELFYNPERLHSALGYKSPAQFEQDWTELVDTRGNLFSGSKTLTAN